MKKTADFEVIDGYEVITAIQDATIDPAATTEAIGPLLEALSETVQAKAITLQIFAQQKIMQDENQAAQAKRKVDPNTDITAEESRWKIAKENITLKEQELKPLTEAIAAARIRLYEEVAVYCLPGPGQKILTPAEEADLAPKFAALQERIRQAEEAKKTDPSANTAVREKLTLEGEIVPDYRGVEYHKKTSGKWKKVKIEAIGEALPVGAILPNDLTPEQKAEIAAQTEADRLEGLTPEQKAAEKKSRLNAVADEAYRLEQRARIQGEDFDTAAYYAEKSAEIDAAYA